MNRSLRAVSGVLLLDKPAACTSNQALQRVKRIYQAAKAGHTGSLDPLATGLLPICLGAATKLCGYLLDADKRYFVRAKLGEKTTTADSEGVITAQSDARGVRGADIETLLPRFMGAQKQVPPMVSALKHQGERLYQLARRGEEVPREPRDIVIFSLQLLGFEPPYFELDVRCSKGTYIRALIEDVAAAIGQCAHVTILRRTELAPFSTPAMATFDELERRAGQGLQALDALLLPPAVALAHRPQVTVDPDLSLRLGRGQTVHIPASSQEGDVAVVNQEGQLLGIARLDKAGLLAPRRWLLVSN